jgi:hypothetical protein
MARPWREIPESEPEPPEAEIGEPAGPVPPALQRVRSALPEELRGRLRSARELDRTLRDEAEEHPPLVTAVPALDRLLDGGLPRGHLVELVGGRTSGRFSALLSALAAATSIGESAALVDLGDALDPATAAALGCDLERLLWVRPANLKEALAGTEMLIGAGFSLVVLDLGAPPVRGGRGVEAGWLRLARTARSHGSALLVGSPYRVSGTAASAVLKASRPRALWQGGEGSPWLLGGLSAHIEVEKHRRRLPGQSEGMMLTAAEAPPMDRNRSDRSDRLDRTDGPDQIDRTWEPLRAVGGG